MGASPSPGEDTGETHADTIPLAEERLELRPSRRFDSSGGLAHLSVLPKDDGTASRAGWTVPVMRRKRRVDRSTAILAACYGVAVLIAAAIVVA